MTARFSLSSSYVFIILLLACTLSSAAYAADDSQSVEFSGNIYTYTNKNAAEDSIYRRIAPQKATSCLITGNKGKITGTIQGTVRTDAKSGALKNGQFLVIRTPACPGQDVLVYYGSKTKNFIKPLGDQRKDKPPLDPAVEAAEKGEKPTAAELKIADDEIKKLKRTRGDDVEHAVAVEFDPAQGGDIQGLIIPQQKDDKGNPLSPDATVQALQKQVREAQGKNNVNPPGFDVAKSKANAPPKATAADAAKVLEAARAPITPEPPCTECLLDTTPKWKDDACIPNKNDYLEKRIPDSSEYLSVGNGDPNLAMPVDEDFRSCVYNSMSEFAGAPQKPGQSGNQFGACNDAGDRVETRYLPSGRAIDKPCASESMVNAVTRAFEAASECLGVDKKEIFPLINHESGFNLNAMSGSSCSGFGQLCGKYAAIESINRYHFDRYVTQLKASPSPKCQTLAKKISSEMMSYNVATNCERIANKVDGRWMYEPSRNIFYTLVYYLENKNDLKMSLEKSSGFNKITDPTVREQIITTIGYLQYNGGPGSVKAQAKKFFEQQGTNFASHEDFYRAFNSYIGSNPHSAWRSPKETQKYLRGIRCDLKKIATKPGGRGCYNWAEPTYQSNECPE